MVDINKVNYFIALKQIKEDPNCSVSDKEKIENLYYKLIGDEIKSGVYHKDFTISEEDYSFLKKYLTD